MKKKVVDIIPEIQGQLKELYKGSGDVSIAGMVLSREQEIKRLEGRLEAIRWANTERLVSDNETHAIAYYKRLKAQSIAQEKIQEQAFHLINKLIEQPRPLTNPEEKKLFKEALKKLSFDKYMKLDLDKILPDF